MTRARERERERDEILDLIRGLSALVVLFAHVRGFVLLDLGQLADPGILTKAFYFGTGIHHQAVMVFFVLSGYFVGGSVMDAFRQRRFSARHYALARLSRLWVALVPALFLTLSLDFTGTAINPEAYDGSLRDRFMSGPEPGSSAGLSIGGFTGNLLFLQTVTLPVFGSNGPLWSLANEFWYYVLFPLVTGAVVCFRRAKTGPNVIAGLLLTIGCGVLVYWLPWAIVSKGFIWLLGVPVWCFARKPWAMELAGNRWWQWITALGFLGVLAASKTTSIFGSDYAVGIAFALWMPSLLGTWAKPGWWRQLGSGLSAISYTLYVVHFPFLFLIAATHLAGRQFPPDAAGLFWFGGLSLASLGLAVVMWWLFERRTDSIRGWIARALRISPAKVTQPAPTTL